MSDRLRLGNEIVGMAHDTLFAGFEAAIRQRRDETQLALELHRLESIRSRLKDIERQVRSLAAEAQACGSPLERKIVDMQIRVCKDSIVGCYQAIDPDVDAGAIAELVEQLLQSLGVDVPNGPSPAVVRGKKKSQP